jgi:hypothetical protein
MSRLFFVLVIIAFVACNDQAATNSTNVQALSDKLDLSVTDSIELYHYDDPTNQKKFYRKYITDSQFIKQVIQDVQAASIQKTPCENDFKMFLYKNGEVYKTIYIATPDSCRYYAYIIDGVTYFKPLSDSAVKMLKSQLAH